MIFTIWAMFWNISSIYFFFFSIQDIKSNNYIIFLKFFSIIFFWWKIYPFPVIFIYKRFIFGYSLRIFFLIFSWFNATVTAYWKHLLSFFLIGFIVAVCFLSNQENLYMIHQDSDLYYDVYNAINEYNQRQTHYFSLNLSMYFDIFFWVIQKIIL